MTDRARLFALAETLPEADLRPAVRFLEYLQDSNDPVLRAYKDAPLDDEPLTEAESLAIDEALEDVAQGRLIPHEQIRQEFLNPK